MNLETTSPTLIQGLKSFGLNPEHWSLALSSGGEIGDQNSNQIYEIRNHDDNDFCFRGWVKNNSWVQLQLISEEELAINGK
ncbi:MAG: hypothetical protein V4736_09285 [Bdellovibrionota bacterium]